MDAESQQTGLHDVRNTFAKYPMIPALKATVAHFTGDPAWATVRPPLVALSGEQHGSLVQASSHSLRLEPDHATTAQTAAASTVRL
jgi:hypothetical protein